MAGIFQVLAEIVLRKGNSDQVLDSAGAKAKAVGEQLKDMPVGFDTNGAEEAIAGITEKVNVQVRSINDWQKELKQLKIARDSAEDTATLDKLNAQIATAEAEVKKLKTPMKEAFDTEPIEKFGEMLDELPEKAQGVAASFNGAKGGGLLTNIFSLEAIGGIGESIDSFADKGKEFANANLQMQAATGVTGEKLEELKAISEEAFNSGVGENIAEATKAITTAQQQLGKFLDPKDMEAFVVQAGAIGKTFDKDVNEVIGGSRTLISNFKLSGQEAGNLISFAMQNAGSKMDDLLDTTDEYSQLAVQAGFSAEEFVGTLTNGVQAGARDTDKLADAIKETQIRLQAGDTSKALKDIATPISATIQGIVAAGEQGKISVKDVMQQSAQEIERAFNAGEITAQMRSQLQVGISGTPAEDIGSDLYGRIFAAPVDVNAIKAKGAEASAAMVSAAGPTNFFEEITRKASSFASGVSASFAPVIAGAGGVLQTVGQLGPGLAVMQEKFGVLDKGAKLASGLSKGMGLVTSAIKSSSIAQAAFNLVMNANPVALILTGIVALGAGLYVLYQNSETVRNALDAVWNVIKAGGEFIGAFVSNYVGSLVKGFQGLGQVISGIINLDFDEVKAGAATVSGAVKDAFIGSASKGVEAFSKSLKDSDKQLDTTKAKGDTAAKGIASSFQQAKSTVVSFKDSLAGLGSSFDAEMKTAGESANTNALQITALKERLKDATLTTDQREIITDEIRSLEKETVAKVKDLQADEKALQNTRIRLGLEKAEQKDFLAMSKAKADQAADELETSLQLQRANEGRTLTTQDELAVATKRLNVLKEEVDKYKLLANPTSTKAKAAQLEIDKATIPTIEIPANLRIEREKALAEMEAAIIALQKQEIELGIRPPSDLLPIFDREIAALESKLKGFQIAGPLTPEQITEQSNLQQQLNDATVGREAAAVARRKEISALKVDLIQDEVERELTLRGIQFEEEMKFVRDAEENGYQLDAEGKQKKALLEKKYAQDVANIRKKGLKDVVRDELDAANLAKTGILAIFKSLYDERKKLSDAEVADKNLGFDKEQTSLQASLQRGEISLREYNTKVGKLNEDRTKFEEELEGQKQSRISAIFQAGYNAVQQTVDSYLQKFIESKIGEMLFTETSEQTKTATVVAGADARSAANEAETGTNVTNAGSSMLGAVAGVIKGAISFLGPIAGPIAGIAASLLIMQAFKGFKSLLGFERGGAVVGEKGPEFIFPGKDAAFMISQLVAAAAEKTHRAVTQVMRGSQGGVGGGRLDVRLTGAAVSHGREMRTTLQHEEISRRSEVAFA